MAQRPVFVPVVSGVALVRVHSIDFTWFPGFSKKQKQRSIEALHLAAFKELGCKAILEVSTKSTDPYGRELSAFNIRILRQEYNIYTTVEAAYQGSKVFTQGGPFEDIFCMNSRDAKRDKRLKSSGRVIGFKFCGEEWEPEPKSAFYDWLYICAVRQNIKLSDHLMQFDAFTDIEFNPERSFSTQAYAAALYVSLRRRGLLEESAISKEFYLDITSYPCLEDDDSD